MRGLCPPALSGPRLIPAAPWQGNCAPKPFFKTQEGFKTSRVQFSQKTDRRLINFPPKTERARRVDCQCELQKGSGAPEPRQSTAADELCRELLFADSVSPAYPTASDRQRQNASWASQTTRNQSHKWNCSADNILLPLTGFGAEINASEYKKA